jgi:hypothetical protein
MKGIDASYYYEGYTLYKTQDIDITDDKAWPLPPKPNLNRHL